MYMPSIFRDDLIDDFFGGTPFRGKQYNRVKENELMKTDIKEHDKDYELLVSVPGVKKEDIKAEVQDGYLTISVTTEKNDEEKDGNYIRKERYHGEASRCFYIGEDVKQDEIKAHMDGGILTLVVPKVEPKEPEVPEKKFISIE